jgi:hypothetical protein
MVRLCSCDIEQSSLLGRLVSYKKWSVVNMVHRQGILKGKDHCTIDLLFDWFGISSMRTDNFCFHLQNRQIQTSQTGGQWYNDTSPFSIPWHSHCGSFSSSEFVKFPKNCIIFANNCSIPQIIFPPGFACQGVLKGS